MEDTKQEEVQLQQVVVVKEQGPTDDPLFDGDTGYVLFDDHCGSSFTAFYPRNDINTPQHDLRNSGLTSGELSCFDFELSGEDSGTAKSDTGNTSPFRVSDEVDVFSEEEDDDEGCVDVEDILYDERVKKKLKVLAAMVGIPHSAATPGVVLGEVVKVLKDLLG